MQNHYNLVYREEEREMIPLCHRSGRGTDPWSPMARGFFAGDRKRGGGGETARCEERSVCQWTCISVRRISQWRSALRRLPRNTASPVHRSRWRGC
ncbi:MAG: hypothetical protein M0C28_44580 [Candidatus Moduliflexus flocculans]|nr:hypothetical protein [Candidatus Moduliflexus flocculans]